MSIDNTGFIPYRCPLSSTALHGVDGAMQKRIESLTDGSVNEGYLVSDNGLYAYPVTGGIPRILPQLAISLETLGQGKSFE